MAGQMIEQQGQLVGQINSVQIADFLKKYAGREIAQSRF